MRYALRLLILLLVTLQTGFTRQGVSAATALQPNDSLDLLRTSLDKAFSDPRFSQAQLGIEVFSLDRSETLYAMNAQRLLIPASCNKLITAAVALTRLGPAYRFETRLLADGKVENGTLKGNLVIVGSGDPSASPNFEDPFATFRSWAAQLKEKKIRKISGDILGDAGAFGEPELGLGWEWNDLPQAFAAPISALQFNDNVLSLEIAPGAEKGSPAFIRTSVENYLKINNRIATVSETVPAAIQIEYGDSNETIDASGTIPLKSAVVSRTIAVRNPALYYLSALKQVLSKEGIADSCGIRVANTYSSPALSPLWIHASPELSEIIKPLLKKSLNLEAETLVRALGLYFRGEGTFAKGKEIVEETLGQMGIEIGRYSFADGSGLSRLNLDSADALVRVLQFMYRERNFQQFFNALPIAGTDGTLSERMKGTRAENNVHAKTGTMTNVSAISGYLKTADGEMLAFSILVNNFIGPKQTVESIQDNALEVLARFSRKGK
jgi:D-alanyl-D-alanine carboxypeptidase/D-alanyl-D-alanine-endopeptidase (penicillin-binding protein 4)